MQQDVINNIVKASGVCAGELILVHFWGEDADKGVANQFMEAVASAGAASMLQQGIQPNLHSNQGQRTRIRA